MKKFIFVLVAGIALITLVGCSTMAAKGPAPSLMAAEKVKMEKKTEVAIDGSGFAPGKEIKLVVDIDGVMTNIGDDLKPEELKVGENGKWNATWDCSRLIDRKLIQEGAYVLTATDGDYSPLAKTSISFHK